MAWIIDTWIEPESFKPKGDFHRASSKISAKPATIREVGIENFVGRKVISACWCLGSYGMGGPGFAGVGFEKTRERPCEWLVLCLWGATEWLRVNGGWDSFEDEVDGLVLKRAKIKDRSCRLAIGPYILSVSESAKARRKDLRGGRLEQPAGESLLDAFVVVPVKSEDLLPQLVV
jgi:hypothetical protein